MKDLLGGKGANLAEMTNMGLPVPPGFTITTEACLVFLKQGGAPPEMLEEAGEHLGPPPGGDGPRARRPRRPAAGERAVRREVLDAGDDGHGPEPRAERPIRRGAREAVRRRRALRQDAYRRFIQMFGKIVMDVPGEAFEEALDRAKERKGPGTQDTDLDADDLTALIEEFRGDLSRRTRARTSRRTRRSSSGSRSRPCSSRGTASARVDYRRQNKISDDLGTAVNVQAMVFGNRGEDSGTGVAFTRDPSTGEKVPVRRLPPERPGRGRRGGDPQHAAARRARGARPRRRTGSSASTWTRSRSTTATCATSSSRSRSGSSGSSRCAWASGPRSPSG